MVQTPTKPNTDNFLLVLPKNLRLSVTSEQFEMLAIANRDLRLERTAPGELIVNPPTGWQTGYRLANWQAQLHYFGIIILVVA